MTRAPFGTTPSGDTVEAFTLANGRGLEVRATNFGGVIVSLLVPDRDGRPANVVLGHDSFDAYLSDSRYFGAIIGRCANRIAHARFTLAAIPKMMFPALVILPGMIATALHSTGGGLLPIGSDGTPNYNLAVPRHAGALPAVGPARSRPPIRDGDVVAEILKEAHAIPADLIVIGTHGRSGFERWILGSITEKTLRKAPCPVLTTRLAEHEFVDEK